MLFYLTDQLLIAEDSPEYDDVMSAICNIAVAVFEHKHDLRGDYKVLKAMSTCSALDKRSRSVIHQVSANYESMPIPREITYYIEVVQEVDRQHRKEGNRVVTQVCYKELTNSSGTQKTCLIGEFYYDCDFYRFILNWFKKENNLGKIATAFENVSGNGITVIDHVKQYLKRDKRPTICIVDTDKKYPSQPIKSNSTCGKCMNKYGDDVKYKFIALEVQEVENLVPLDVIDSLNWNGAGVEFKKHFDTLRNHAESEQILAYFDIKNGIKNDNMFLKEEAYRAFAKLCYSYDVNNPPNSDFETHCKQLPPDGVIFPMLSSNLLRNSNEYLKTHPNVQFTLLDYQKKEWIKIAQSMLNWGVCRNQESLH